uniref:hypothetical protein n=1 Tax=Flavobacterium sp. TaxID=239 RepID=UPI00404A0457
MKQIIYLSIVIFTIACADEKSSYQKDEVDNLIKQTEAIDLDTTQLYSEQQIVSKSFLDLVKFIDTSGFICDSVRFQKTYRRVNQQRKIKIKDYLFYELNLEETVPILENYSVVENRIDSKAKSNDTLALKQTLEWKKRWQINKHLFEKVTKTTAYFYVEKSLFNRNG